MSTIKVKNKGKQVIVIEGVETITRTVSRTVALPQLKRRLQQLIERELELNEQLNAIKAEKDRLAALEPEIEKALA